MKINKGLYVFSIITILAGTFVSGSQCIMAAGEDNNRNIEIYVDPNGNDNADGSIHNPFKTIERAKTEVRSINSSSLEGDVIVNIGKGTYVLNDTLEFTPEDSGNNGHNIIYRGKDYPLLSGGKRITDFVVLDNGMWKAYVPDLESIRELYVNDTRVYRASTEREVRGKGDYIDPDTGYQFDGIYFDRDVLDLWDNADQIELRWGIGWKCQDMKVDKIILDPDNDTQVIAIMKQPYYNFAATVPLWGHAARWDYGFRIENAYELLDSPGEYYFNSKTHELFYLPRSGENIETAEIWAPVLETLISVSGKEKSKAANIRFENIRFAHAAYSLPDLTGYSHGQAAENFIGRSPYERTTPAALELTNADNINFYGCVIFGTGAGGLRLRHAVENSSFVGGAVYDTGESAISVGCPSSAGISEETEKPENNMGDAIYNSIITCSDYGAFGNGLFALFSDGDWKPVNDIQRNIASWVMIDFGKEISIDDILLTINVSGEETEKKNFKISASNDPDFNVSEKIYEQGLSAFDGNTLSLAPKLNEKYRYLKIEKTKVEEFLITDIQVLSKDILWQPKTVCKNINISNNYITRTGNYYYGSPAICSYYTEDLLISHNEIYKTPYSAISAGWGWSNKNTWTKRTKIYNNKIDSYNMESQDGGGLYTLSRCDGGEIKGNYFKNEHGPFGALYFDEGSAGFDVSDNVVEDSNYPVFIWISTDMDINVRNTYSNSPRIRNFGTNTFVEPIKTYVAGNPSPEAKKIIDESGLEKEFIGIKDIVPDSLPYYGRFIYDDYSSFIDHYPTSLRSEWGGFEELARETVKNASIGYKPGQYDPKAMAVLENRIDEMNNATRTTDNISYGQAERIIRVREALKSFENSLKRYSFDDTLKYAETLLESTQTGENEGDCDTESKRKFNISLLNIKSMTADEYTKLKLLEKAIDDFDKNIIDTNIYAFEVKEEDICADIDQENKTIILHVPDSYDVKNVKANVVCASNAKVYPDFSKGVDISYPIQAVVRCENINSIWTIKAEPLENKGYYSDEWWNWYEIRPIAESGKVIFKPAERPYMFTGGRTNEFEFRLTARELDREGVSVFFLSDKAELVPETLSGEHSYFELNITDRFLKLFRVEENQRKTKYGGIYRNDLIKEGGFESPRKTIYGGIYENDKIFKKTILTPKTDNYFDVKVKTYAEGERNRIEVYMNGRKVINVLCDADRVIDSGYWGIRTKKTEVVLENIR